MGLLLSGLPSEPTLCRVFKNIDDEAMASRISAFVDVFCKEINGWDTDIICIDGKTMRGTVYENGRNPDIVSAYSLRGGLTLDTDVCEKKSNEIKSLSDDSLCITRFREETVLCFVGTPCAFNHCFSDILVTMGDSTRFDFPCTFFIPGFEIAPRH